MEYLYNLIENNLILFLVIPNLTIIITLIIYLPRKKGEASSLSGYIAKCPKLLKIFAFFFTIVLLPFDLILAFYLIPKYNIPEFLKIIVGITKD